MTSFSDLEASLAIFLRDKLNKGAVEAFIQDFELRGIDPGQI